MKKLCPSASMESASLLLGIISNKGTVDYFATPMKINHDFKDEAKKGRKPEARFRFAAPCVEERCLNWSSKENCCNICKTVSLDNTIESRKLPDCGIRHVCRWFSQSKSSACKKM